MDFHGQRVQDIRLKFYDIFTPFSLHIFRKRKTVLCKNSFSFSFFANNL